MILKQIISFNLYEDVICTNHYEVIFDEFLTRCGYTITKTECKDDKKKSDKDDSDNEDNYNAIESLNAVKLKEVCESIKKGCATEVEKLQCEKHFFKNIVKCDDNKTEADIVFKLYCNRFGKQLLLNCAKEINSDVVEVLQQNLVKSSFEETRSTDAMKLHFIKKIVKLLKISNSQDTATVIDKKVLHDKLYPYVSKYQNSL